jgi:hypothetical protein
MKTDAIKQALALNPLIASPYRNLVANSVIRWTEASGFSWSSDRCKSIIAYLLKLKAGEEPERPQWISCKYLTYAEKIVASGSWYKFVQLIQIWRIFTALQLKISDPDVKSVDKFEGALEAPPHIFSLKKYERMKFHPYLTFNFKEVFELAGHKTRSIQSLFPEMRLLRVVEVKNPLALRTRSFSSKEKKFVPSKEWDELIHDSHVLPLTMGESMRIKVEDRPYALRQIPILYLDPHRSEYRDFSDGVIGTVKCRVQPDGKARFYYSPSQWEQFLLHPFADALMYQLKSIQQDCTYDQVKGAKKVMEWLKEGKTVWSFDLSSATDRFPLALTRSILFGLNTSPNWRMWVNTFSILARTYHRVGYAGSKATHRMLKWNCGQPLGLNASFAAFALSHHAVMRGLYPGEPSQAPYVILGDDLVIADETLAKHYREFMRFLHVDISETKSLRGCLGEFAGRFIGDEGYAYKVKYQYLTLRSLPNMLNLLGPRALKGMRATPLRNVIALIPTESTPSGINPGGFCKAKVDRFLTQYLMEDEVDPPLEPLVDSKATTLARDEVVRAISPYSTLFSSTLTWNPIGSSSVGIGGAPKPKSFTSSKVLWHESPYQNRAWLRKVIRLGKQAKLL